MIRFTEERQGCVANLNDSDSFNDLIRELTLIDITLGERSFTWSNKRDIPAVAKLNEYLVSEAWDDNFPLTTSKRLPNTLSNHLPSPSIHLQPPKVYIDSTFKPCVWNTVNFRKL